MKLCILYHPDSDQASPVEAFAREVTKRTNEAVDLVSLETKEGDSMANLYDILDYPAVLVIREDHQLNKEWQGSSLPSVDEVIGYLV